ncbi:hypothetical protein FA13DRAFT_1744489 [Coprinellus micaceus]|uniref:Uncharacterized protein n=1 Tax=Coprinellus micaceus TaxID=71717 RepID=A0A4Y7SDE0_COPMI|nr:hypothetical protein FA13DRAFT_1744489 [Coprinellus micaceus]
MTTTKSSRNPFRDPLSSWLAPLVPPTPSTSRPNASPTTSTSTSSIAHTQPGISTTSSSTGSLNSSAATPGTTPGTQYAPPPGPPPSSASPPSSSSARQPQTHSPPSSDPSAATGTFGLDDELPPAYTPSADVYSGEHTVEYGPARPFQPPPSHPVSQSRPPAAPLNQQHSTSHFPFPPQTRPPPGQGPPGSGQRLGSFLTQLAELAINRQSPPSRPANQYAPPAGPPPPQHPSHAPPSHTPQLPPRRHDAPSPTPSGSSSIPPNASSDFARDFYAAGAVIPGEGAAAQSSAPTSPSSAPPPVLGKPTTTPTPGHPYLHDGKLLVYPRGFECTKCRNIGYKLPSLKPCKRCWPKYGRPFSGPLAYSFSNPDMTQGDLETSSNLQRPLPPPPPIGPRRDPPLPSPSSGAGPSFPGLSAANSRVVSPGGMFNMGLVTPGGPPRPTLLAPPSQNLHPLFSPSVHGPGRPPAGSIVYPAGDPRLGGRMCWRCDGQGTVSFMLVDREQCGVCGGVGRVYP